MQSSPPKLSVFLPISRPDVGELISSIQKQTVKADEYIALIDTDTEIALPDWIKTHYTGRGKPIEPSVTERRKRIVQVNNEARDLIGDTDYVISVEDDTIIPEDAFEKLLYMATTKEIGTAQGVQVGRWGIQMIGAWRVNDVHNPTEALTLPYISTDARVIEKIDAGGWYCYITPTKLFKEIERGWHGEPYGPDVVYGLELRKKGYQNYIDWSLVTGHQKGARVLWPDAEYLQTVYYKDGKRIRP